MERWNLRQRGKLGSDGRTLNEIRLLFNALEMVLLALQGVSGIFTTASDTETDDIHALHYTFACVSFTAKRMSPRWVNTQSILMQYEYSDCRSTHELSTLPSRVLNS